MTTAANVRKSESSHWYYRDGRPCYELPKKSGSGMKKTTLADARELNLLPSVTTILKVVNKPALQDWLIAQAVLAVMTTPRLEGEQVDAFIHRVLQVERVQDQEAGAAADKGSEIHKAVALAIQGKGFDDQWQLYVQAVFPVIESLGKVIWSEKILVGQGYAGRGDLALETDRHIVVLDLKSTRKVPKESYPEHKMQLGAYAGAFGNTADRHLITGNLYISTANPGEVNLCLSENWEDDYTAFMHAFSLWKYLNNYYPSI